MANGVASLDANAKIPDIELPIDLIHTSKIGMANGIASLDANARIPDIELPIDLIHASQIGMPGGVASLGSDGKVPEAQLPPTSSGDKIKGWRNIGGSNFYGNNVWTDGTDIYMSNGTGYQWVLTGVDPLTWANKTWNGYINIIGDRVWTDGTNIYYSNTNDQYVLDKSTGTWSAKTWNWATTSTALNGKYIWTDGIDIYYSNSSYQYVLDKATSTWSVKTWTGLTQFVAEYLWTDGTNIYFSYGNNQYVLDVATSTWSAKTWSGVLTKPDGRYIWTDGENIYYSDGTNEYVYDKSTNTWLNNAWIGGDTNKVNGSYIWTDGTVVFFNNGTNAGECRLTEYSFSNILGFANGLATLDTNTKLRSEQTNYVSTGRKSGTTVGNNSTAEGYNTTASAQYSHAEGNQTQATASAAHAEGTGTKATSQNAHAEGWDSTASGGSSHAEGYTTTASGNYSHAEGHLTKAQHAKSHAEGYNTQTGAEPQHVQGQYNIGKSDTAMEIGWGTSNVNRINIFEVYQNGNVVAAGDIYDGADNKLSDIKSLSKIVNGDEIFIDSTSGDSSLSGVTVTLSRTDANHITATTSDSQTKYFVLDSDVAGEFGLIEAHIHDDGDTREYYANLLVGDTKTVECNRYPGDSIFIDFYTPTGIYNLDVSYDIKAGGDIIDGGGNVLSNKINNDAGFAHTDDITYNPDTKTVTCSKSGTGWTSQIYSKSGYKDNVFVTFRASQTNKDILIGFSESPSIDAGYSNINYGIYINGATLLRILENGTEITPPAGHTNYAVGDELRIEYSGGYVRYYHNGVLIRSVARAIGNPLYLDSSFYTSGSVYDLDFRTGLGNIILADEINESITMATGTDNTLVYTYTAPFDGYLDMMVYPTYQYGQPKGSKITTNSNGAAYYTVAYADETLTGSTGCSVAGYRMASGDKVYVFAKYSNSTNNAIKITGRLVPVNK